MNNAVVRIARGPRATLALLMEEIAAFRRRAPYAPLRVVVPSKSLRLALGRALVQRFGAVAGVKVQTLHTVAEEVLERAGQPFPAGGALFDVLVRRVAAEQSSLAASLGGLDDGFGAVAGTVRELLDAGLQPFDQERCSEALAEAGMHGRISPVLRDRAEAILEVAVRCAEWMEEEGVARPSAVLSRAAELLQQDEGLLPGAIRLYGFADATGVGTELLLALLRRADAVFYMDHPPDPASPLQVDSSRSFPQRLQERLLLVASVETVPDFPAPPEISAFHAPGAFAEAREVAFRVRQLLDQGVAPEEIGIVARELGPYRSPLRVQLGRLGVPWSGVDEPGPPNAAVRRVRALLDLLWQREDTPVDRWLACLISLPKKEGQGALFSQRPRPPRHDLRVALRVVGAATLDDIARIDVGTVAPDKYLPLPVRRAMEGPAEEEDGEEITPEIEPKAGESRRVSRRHFSGEKLAEVVRSAVLSRQRLQEWHREGTVVGPHGAVGIPVAAHLEHLLALLNEDLGWLLEVAGIPEVMAALRQVSQGIPPHLCMSQEEFVLLVVRVLKERVAPFSLGGEGGGVQVLSVVEARERCFSHLFLMGLGRDQFPRPVREDALLPDPARWILRSVLSDIPLKLRGFEEERYLFASLVSSSPRVCLSYPSCDDEGKEKPASPLISHLPLALGVEVETAPPVIPGAPPVGENPRIALRPAMEAAILSGLFGSRDFFGDVLDLALAEAGTAEHAQVAAGRLAVLEEMDPDRRNPEGWKRFRLPGPYLGFLGAIRHPSDPRNDAPHLTVVENLAACGWQVLLQRILKVEDVPDPTLSLPGFERHLVGTVVHSTLEHLVREAFAQARREMPADLENAREAVTVPWPPAEALERLVLQRADETIRNRGIGIPGFSRVLAQHALPLLEVVRKCDWPEGKLAMLGVEIPGRLKVEDGEGRPRSIPFIADRVDANQRITEYKTGKTISEAKTEKTRHAKLLEKVQRGERLQAIAYALALGHPEAEGRFFFVGPDTDDSAREFAAHARDAGLTSALMKVSRVVLEAWERGTLLARVVEPTKNEEPARCKFCEVASACSRKDSGHRMRLQKLVESWEEIPSGSPDERSWLELWKIRMGDATSGEEG